MKKIKGNGTVELLPKRKGGYHYIAIDKVVVNQFPKQKKTRLLCTINNASFPCGFNPLGNGDYYIILGAEKRKQCGIQLGETIAYELAVNPNLLGVAEPEILCEFLAQDPLANAKYKQLTDGKKRSLIFALMRVKDIDRSAQKIRTFLEI